RRRRRGADRPAAVRQRGGRRLRGAPRRSGGRSRNRAGDRRARDRRTRRRARAASRRGDPHLHRRADAGGRRHRVHAGRRARAGLIERLGAASTDLGIVPDDPDKLARALSAAAGEHDLVLTTGGVSTGEADHVRRAVEAVGRLVFWRVAIKPGRPVAMGVIPGAGQGPSAVFVGLPGNPAAVYVTFARVVRPLLLRLAGAEAAPLLA